MPPRKIGPYRLEKHLGNGSFGDVYMGYNVVTKQRVAIKVENHKSAKPKPGAGPQVNPARQPRSKLYLEYKIYKSMHGSPGFPEVYYYGHMETFDCMAMEHLGLSLEHHLRDCGGTFSVATVVQLGVQLVTRIEQLHASSYVHRDIKPENFLVGREGAAGTVFMIDMGLATTYRSPQSRKHASMMTGRSLTGTLRYLSIHAHKGYSLSRRDDLESLMYMLVYFLLGRLPWQGMSLTKVSKGVRRKIGRREQYKMIRRVKERHAEGCLPTQVKEQANRGCMWRMVPKEFATLFQYVRSMRFEEKPDYIYIRKLLRAVGERHGVFPEDALHFEAGGVKADYKK